jgi:hypothetical protein
MRMMRCRTSPFLALAQIIGCFLFAFFFAASLTAAESLSIAVVRPDLQTGFAIAGWNHDRYADLPSLDAHRAITVCDVKGPGVIRHIHITRHILQPKELIARGIVLQIWFDDAAEPAVQCPLADFFGDGCNGEAADFSTPLVECVPLSYNAYIPMPFKSRARVVLRNDTDVNMKGYSHVEWENLPEWNDKLGYFHAAFNRKCFQLTKDTNETLFHVEGTGHLIGRQYSIVSDEPLFASLAYVTEANNEVDIDGQPRKLDYLGLEDSFTFSWGFPRPFVGLRSGMTLIKRDMPSMVSMYRFHDHQPIRFNKSLTWRVNWDQERELYDGWEKPSQDEKAPLGSKWAAALSRGGCWVDFATVHYWYQTAPGGYRHAPLPSPGDRAKPILRPATKSP